MKLRRQRGVAVITALLLTTLAVTIVASLFWQQQVQVRSMENQRLQLQTRWILRGALDLSRLVLNQDLLTSPVTQINGVWATPLAETRLDDYVERERLQGENFNATLSGRMTDAQSRYNLANLATNRSINADQLKMFQRLLENLRLDPNLAQGVAELVANAQMVLPTQQQTGGTGSGAGSGTGGGTGGGTTSQPDAAPQPTGGAEPMSLVRVEDLLAVAGFTPQAVEQLRDFVIILPSVKVTALNVNTAPPELIAALVDGLSVSEAQALVNVRDRGQFYRNATDFQSLQQLVGHKPLAPLDVKSNYFLAYSQVKLDRATLSTQALLERPGIPNTKVVWIREY